jgi:hypothetical protein
MRAAQILTLLWTAPLVGQMLGGLSLRIRP